MKQQPFMIERSSCQFWKLETGESHLREYITEPPPPPPPPPPDAAAH